MKKLNLSYARQSFKRTVADSTVIWQRLLIAEHANKQGYIIDKHYEDIKSGHKVNREGLQEVLRLIKDDKVSRLTVYRIDRIYRNYRASLEFFRLCAEKEIIIDSIEDGVFNFRNAEERLSLQILSATAENQREVAVANKKLNNKRKFLDGRPVNFQAPFGYKYYDHAFTIVPDEAETVKFIFDQYLEGKGYKKISALTEDEQWFYRAPWQVRNILLNPKYCGHLVGTHGTLKNFLPAIVSQQVFEQAQDIRVKEAEKRKQKGTVNAKLRKKVVCPYCKSKLTPFHYRSQNGTPKYVCRKKLSGQYHDCNLRAVNMKALEHKVQITVLQFLNSSIELDKLSDSVRNQLKQQKLEAGRKGDYFSTLRQKKIDQLAEGTISIADFKEWLQDFEVELMNLKPLPDIEVKTDHVRDLLKDNSKVAEEIFSLVTEVHIDKQGKPTDIRIDGCNENILTISKEKTTL